MQLKDIKQNLALTFPILLTRLLGIASNLIVMVLVAKLGGKALSASALVMSIFSVCILLIMAFSFSVCSIIAEACGNRKPQEVGEIVRSSLFLNTLLAIPFLLIFYNITPILIALHQPNEIAALVGAYFYGMIPGYVIMLWTGVLEQLLIGISKPRYLVYLSVGGLCIMPAVSSLLMFGYAGVPALGMLGAGYAVSVSSVIGFLFLMTIIISKKWHHHYHLFTFNNPINKKMMLKLAQLGWPMSAQFAAEFLAYTLMTLMMGWIGLIALAAQQIVLQFTSVIVMIPTSVSQATSVLVGQARRQPNGRISASVHSAIAIVFTLMSLIALAYLLLPELLASIYLSPTVPQRAEILSLTTTLLAIIAISQLFDGIKNVIAGAYRGLQETKTPMFINSLSLWLISIPLAYLAAFPLHAGAVGIRLGFAAGVIFSSITLTVKWFKRYPLHNKEENYMDNNKQRV